MNTLDKLEKDGVVILPGFIPAGVLPMMQRAFEARLQRPRWNDFDGYERTERFRHMVQDVLVLEQGFVDAALHPLVKETLKGYIGEKFALVEAKGWKSLATMRLFHGWHADAWYDQTRVSWIPREVKLAFYLTDVKSGAFQYVKGSHRQQAPRSWGRQEVANFPASDIVEVTGEAGTAFLFDTSGVHRQSSPILEARNAVFYNYHDPSIPLQQEDIDYYRYHPLVLNAAFLGNLTAEDQYILGFGDKTNYEPAFSRKSRHAGLQKWQAAALDFKLRMDEFTERVTARLRRARKGA